ILFTLIYADISLVNHYMLRTYALDLGIYNHSLWSYSVLKWDHCTIMNLSNILADHFEVYPIILSPLRYIFGTYTLLLVQIAAIIAGGWGVLVYLRHKTQNETLSILGMVHFLLGWGIYSALSFDYHNNVVAAMLVPWFLYYFDKKNIKAAALFFLLIL